MSRINKLQTACSTQVLHIFDKLKEWSINISNLPTTPPTDAGWYVVTQPGTVPDTTITYQDFVSDPSYYFMIQISYDSTATGTCIANPVKDCTCIVTSRTNTAGTYVDAFIPDDIIDQALHTLSTSITEICDEDETDIFNNLNRKRVDLSKIPYASNRASITTDGWYKTIDTYSGRTITIYVDTSTDANNDYEIDIDTGDTDEITSCTDISSDKTDKSGYPAADRIIPSTVKSKAISTLPTITTACGTGLWNGCILNIPNKYLIIGGGLVAAALYIMKK